MSLFLFQLPADMHSESFWISVLWNAQFWILWGKAKMSESASSCLVSPQLELTRWAISCRYVFQCIFQNWGKAEKKNQRPFSNNQPITFFWKHVINQIPSCRPQIETVSLVCVSKYNQLLNDLGFSMYLWLRSVFFLSAHIQKYRCSSHSYSIQSRILSQSCMLWDDLALLSISSHKIWLLLVSKMPWKECIKVIWSELGGELLLYPLWPPLIMVMLKLMVKWVSYSSWPVLSWPFMFRHQTKPHISHKSLWEIWKVRSVIWGGGLPVYFMHNSLLTDLLSLKSK